uniref:BESS domain-containing protein n=1 Tax=Meloidogyne hapla TaxID=6305 RepID=A0A1I8BZP0_MELHA
MAEKLNMRNVRSRMLFMMIIKTKILILLKVINNLDSFTQQPKNTGIPPFRNTSTINERNIEDDEDSAQIGSMLFQTQDSFLRLVREKKDALVKLFPELFSNLRTTPAIFEAMPSTVMETS